MMKIKAFGTKTARTEDEPRQSDFQARPQPWQPDMPSRADLCPAGVGTGLLHRTWNGFRLTAPITKGNDLDYDDRSTKRQVPETAEEIGGQPADPRQSQVAAARADSHQAPLPNMWPGPGGLSQVRHLPHLLPKHGQQRSHPRSPEGELVIRNVVWSPCFFWRWICRIIITCRPRWKRAATSRSSLSQVMKFETSRMSSPRNLKGTWRT